MARSPKMAPEMGSPAGVASPHFELVGVSHRTLGVSEREVLTRLEESPEALQLALAKEAGVPQVAVLSTCNRFEVLSVGEGSGNRVRQYLANSLKKPVDSDALYFLQDTAAIQHIFRVCSGLDSMVLGEAQILSQVKDCYQRAVKLGYAGKELHHLYQFAFSLAKKIRGHTAIADHAVSVSYVAVKLAQQIFGSLENRSVLLEGSGKMAELAALHLKSLGCSEILVANRTIERAGDLARRIGGSALALSELDAYIPRVDVVIGSITIDRPILEVSFFKKNPPKKALFLLDLGVPRNFSSTLSEIDNVYLYNIDDLAAISEQNRALREDAAKDAELLIQYGEFQFKKWLLKVRNEYAILNLRERVRDVCAQELRGIGVLPSEQLENLSHRISQKLSHELLQILERSGKLSLNADESEKGDLESAVPEISLETDVILEHILPDMIEKALKIEH